MNYKITLAFDGSLFSGWQFQKNAPTVQATVTECATRMFASPVTVTGCSRTDSGVHAENYVCNVISQRELPCDAIVRGMNTFLPPSIAVKSCETVSEDFHARYNCVSKEYHYKILNSPIPDPFLAKRVYNVVAPLDVEKMKKDASFLVGKHDFTSFMASGSKITDPVRTIFYADVDKKDDMITFSVCADGFLYNMVRIIVGTLIDLNLRRTELSMSEIIASCDRSKAGFTVAPDGLYLYRVNY